MANYFTLTKIGQETPSRFADIDNDICKEVGITPDDNKYYLSWYDIIGLALAIGKDWEWCKNEFKNWPEMLTVINFLEKNYISNAWASR